MDFGSLKDELIGSDAVNSTFRRHSIGVRSACGWKRAEKGVDFRKNVLDSFFFFFFFFFFDRFLALHSTVGWELPSVLFDALPFLRCYSPALWDIKRKYRNSPMVMSYSALHARS